MGPKTVDRLVESIVTTVGDAAHRRFDARLHPPLGYLIETYWAAAVAVTYEPAAMDGPPITRSIRVRSERALGLPVEREALCARGVGPIEPQMSGEAH
jgi:hypothetical protein